MRIAINAQLLSAPHFGITTYIKALMESIAKIDSINDYFAFAGKDSAGHIPDSFKLIDLGSGGGTFGRVMREQLLMPFAAAKNKIDVFHNPDHILPIAKMGCKTVVTVHDLSFLKYPRAFSAGKRLYKQMAAPSSVRKADRIIAVSQNTKKDIISLFGTDSNKIKVIYNGVSPVFMPINDKHERDRVTKRYGLYKPFVLFIGTLEPRKNLSTLIKAFSRSVAAGLADHELVIAGKRGWLWKEVLKTAGDSGLGERIRFIDDVRPVDLPLFYNLADVFAYPSIYEGFGLPVLEAMACGIPVITSNVSSIPEVAGDAALLVDPYDIDGLAEALHKVVSDRDLKQQMRDKGIERAKLFTWDKCASETLKVYEEAYKLHI